MQRFNGWTCAVIALAAVVSYGGSLSTPAASATLIDDIEFWVGEGENRAGMIFDWNDGKSPEALAWGYRWDGDATVFDMLTAVAGRTVYKQANSDTLIDEFSGADERLFLRLSMFDFGGGVTGDSIFGVGYDLDGDGGAFTDGFEGNPVGFASDPDDHYFEGWFDASNAFWFSSISLDAGATFGDFATPQTVLTDELLVAWAVDPFTFNSFPDPATIEPGPAPNDIPGSPGSPGGVPEPATIVLLLSSAGLMCRRGRRGACDAGGADF